MAGKKAEPLAVVHRDSAGIDVGKRKHYVAVDPSRFDEPVRNFGTFTQDLEAMAEWLSSCGVREVAMESTGVYWVPVFEVLDRAGFEVHLVNPRATKQVSGRKSDVLDCQWIRQLMSYGLLRGAFRSPDALCPMRSYVRQRGQLIRDRSRAVQHMQKALGQMNVQLDNVLSDIMGKTGQLIVRAIVAGERDGAALAKFRDGRCKADETTIAASLRGNWRGEHLFALQQALARHDLLQGQIEACEARIDGELDGQAPDGAANEPSPARRARESVVRERLHRMLGADLTAIPTVGVETALTVAAEVGADLSRFATAAHFCSWLGLAPGTRISGDKRLGGPSARHTNRVGQALRMAASTARNSNTTIGAAHRRRLARMDSAKAVKATAHQLARLIYAMLTRGQAIRRAGSGDDGNGAPRPPDQEPATSSAALRPGARAGRTSRLKAGILKPGISGLGFVPCKRATGKSLVPSSFHDRFTPGLARMFRAVLAQLMRKLASSDVRYGGVLEGLRDGLAADATVVKVHRLLARRFPGTRTNCAPAAAKLHLVMSVRGTGVHKVKVTGERAKDHRTLQMGPWVEGRLLLFDLGYFRYQLFDCIDRNGGYFITRLAANANPRIVAIHRQWRGRAIDLEGKRLKEVASRLQRAVLDVEVEVAFQRRVYAGTRRTVRRRVRLVAVRLPQSTEYRFYLTNIDPDSLDAQCVAQTSAARWQIELIFKELKSHYRLDELPTSKAHIVETLLLGAVITLLVSRRLLQAVRERLTRTAYKMPEQRWAALFAGAATTILDIVVLPARGSGVFARRLESMLLHEAPDPNRSRRLLIERVESGAAWA